MKSIVTYFSKLKFIDLCALFGLIWLALWFKAVTDKMDQTDWQIIHTNLGRGLLILLFTIIASEIYGLYSRQRAETIEDE